MLEFNILFTMNPFRYRGYYYDVETGWYYLQSRYYNPQWGRFLNADGYVNANEDILGYNMFAYCGNNPVNRIDVGGDFWSELWAEISQTIESLTPVYAGCGGAAIIDGPLPVGDIIGIVGAGLLTVGVVGYSVCQVKKASSISKPTKKEAVANPSNGPTVIYRYGGTKLSNFVPSDIDEYTCTGLSFSTIPKAGAAVTTIEMLNATGIVYAVRDGKTHVSVYPVGGTIPEWRKLGTEAIWTRTIQSIVVPYGGK